jgi:hypothetical protein
MSKVNAYVLEVCLFLLFWIVIGGQILSLRIANTYAMQHEQDNTALQ